MIIHVRSLEEYMTQNHDIAITTNVSKNIVCGS